MPQSLAATLVVTSTADSVPGALLQALLDAVNGNTITCDPAVFPPGVPATIFLADGLPGIRQGGLPHNRIGIAFSASLIPVKV